MRILSYFQDWVVWHPNTSYMQQVPQALLHRPSSLSLMVMHHARILYCSMNVFFFVFFPLYTQTFPFDFNTYVFNICVLQRGVHAIELCAS